jgi:hypothetical protein
MSRVEVKEAEVPVEVIVEKVNELLKRYDLRGETRMMNISAVSRLCGTIESRRISKAKQIEAVAKATGRYPYVVFAFQREKNVLCMPDANYYVADGMYDVHVIDCNGNNGVRCAEVAANVADIFGLPISREALLMLADESELCSRNILPCKKRAKEQPEAPEALLTERREVGDVEVPAVVNEIKNMLLAMRDSMRQGQQPMGQQPTPAAPAPPMQPPPPAPQPTQPAPQRPPPDPKAILKEVGLGWLVPILDDQGAAAAVRFVMENREVLNMLKDEEKRKIVVQAIKEGGVPVAPSSTLDRALEKWSPKEREKLLPLLSKTRDLYSLASALIEYLTNNYHCTFEVAKTILDTAAERGLTCEAVAQMLSQ